MKTIETKLFSAALSQTGVTVDDTPNGTLKVFSGTITLTNRYIKPGTLVLTSTTAQSSVVIDDTPDGSDLTFSGTITLTNRAIKPSTVTLTATVSASPVTITDNGSGVLAGTGVTGTLNYTTGAYALTFTTAPDNSTDITGVYDYYSTITDNGEGILSGNTITGTINYGTGAYSLSFTTAPKNTTDITGVYSYVGVSPVQVTAADTTKRGASGVLIYEGSLLTNIIQGSVSFAINFSSSPVTLSDDEYGNITGTNLSYGYVDYETGYFKLVFTTSPDAAATLSATYQHRNSTVHEELLDTKYEDCNLVVVRNTNSTAQYFQLSVSDDNKSSTYVGSYYVSPGAFKVVQLLPKRYYRIYGSGAFFKVELENV